MLRKRVDTSTTSKDGPLQACPERRWLVRGRQRLLSMALADAWVPSRQTLSLTCQGMLVHLNLAVADLRETEGERPEIPVGPWVCDAPTGLHADATLSEQDQSSKAHSL